MLYKRKCAPIILILLFLNRKAVLFGGKQHILLARVYNSRNQQNGVLRHIITNAFKQPYNHIRHNICADDIEFSAHLIRQIAYDIFGLAALAV